MKIGCKESLERLQKELIGKDWFMTFLDFDAYKKGERQGAGGVYRSKGMGEKDACQYCRSRLLLIRQND